MVLAHVAQGDPHVFAHNDERDAINALTESAVLPYDVTAAPFSAVPNGTTDCADAINAAISAANADGGGTVIIPKATSNYRTGSTIVMKSNVTLIIEGSVQLLASHTGAGITAMDTSNIAIIGTGTIDMNKAATTNGANAETQMAVHVNTSTNSTNIANIKISGITVKNGWQRGIQVAAYGGNASTFTNVVISETKVINFTGIGILVMATGNSTNTTVAGSRGIWIERNQLTTMLLDGIVVSGVSDVMVARNVVNGSSSNGHGICIGLGTGNLTDHVTDFVVASNNCRGFTAVSKWGIVVSARCNRFAVTNNLCIANRGGISIDVTDATAGATVLWDTDGTVTGNTCQNNTGSTLSHGMYINHAKGLAITGNVCRSNAGSGILLGQCASCTVVGNITISNSGAGIYLAGTTPATVGGHVVAGNKSVSNTTNQYLTDAAPVASTQGSTAAFATV